MASDFVRSLKNVSNINHLSSNIVEENDIVSQTDGRVFIRKATGFIEVTGSVSDEDIKTIKSDITTIKSDITTIKSDITKIKSDITTIKSEQTKIKNRLDELEKKKE